MGHRVRIYASRKWQLSLTLGGEGSEKPRDRIAELEKPVGGMGPGLRIIWPEQDVQPDIVGDKSRPQA